MMVEVMIGGMSATAEGGQWVDGDEVLLDILRQDLSMRWVPLFYDPFPSGTIAREALARYGGRIVKESRPPFTDGVIY